MADDSRLAALFAAISAEKHGDPFRPVIVLCGEGARRDIVAALARQGTWIGIEVEPLSAYVTRRAGELAPRTLIRRSQILASVARTLDSEDTAFHTNNTADQPATRRALSAVIERLFALPPKRWAELDSGANRPLVAEAARIAAAVSAEYPATFTRGEAREHSYATTNDGGERTRIIAVGVLGEDRFDDAFLGSTTNVEMVAGERFTLPCAEEAEEVDAIVSLVSADIAAGIPLDQIAVGYCSPSYLPLLRQRFAEAAIPFRAPSLLKESDTPGTRALLELVSIRADTMDRRALARVLATGDVSWKSSGGSNPTLRGFDRFTRGKNFVVNTVADLQVLPDDIGDDPHYAWMLGLQADLESVEREATWAGSAKAIGALARTHLRSVPHPDVLDMIGTMDGIMPPPTRELLTEIMSGELDRPVEETVEGETVRISPLTSLAGRIIERAYVCGATASAVPGPVQEDPAITFDQMDTSPEDIARRREATFEAATTAGTRTVVSYPTSHLDGSGQAVPTLLLDSVPRLPEITLSEAPSPGAARVRIDFARRGGVLEGLEPARAAVRAREDFAHANQPGAEYNGYVSAQIGARSLEREISATQLEAYCKNPLDYLLKYGLDARVLEDPDPSATIDPRDRGVLYHSIFEKWTTRVWLQATPRPSGGSDIDWVDAKRVLQEITDEELSHAQSGRYSPTAWAQFAANVREVVLGWFADEKSDADAGWVPVATELAFGGRSGGDTGLPAVELSNGGDVSLSLRGDIDRLDVNTLSGRLRVTDYKSGQAKYTKDALASGPTGTDQDKKLQLGLYAYLVDRSLAEGLLASAVPGLSAADREEGTEARYYFFLEAQPEDVSVGTKFGKVELAEFAEELLAICASICAGVFPPGKYFSGFRSGPSAELLRMGVASYSDVSESAEALGVYPLSLTSTEVEDD